MNDDSMLPGDKPEPRATPGSKAEFARSAGMAVGRGTLLIGVAVIIGVLLLQVVDPGPSAGSASVTTTTKTTTVTTTPGTGSTVTTNTAPTSTSGGGTHTPAQIHVVVLNGSGVQGAAGVKTTALKNKGYNTGTPGDATTQTGTTTACASGYTADAAGIVAIIGGKAIAYPASPPNAASGYSCYVVLGK
jgi:hypothetical protein